MESLGVMGWGLVAAENSSAAVAAAVTGGGGRTPEFQVFILKTKKVIAFSRVRFLKNTPPWRENTLPRL